MKKTGSKFSRWFEGLRDNDSYWSGVLKSRFADQLDRRIIESGKTRSEFAAEVGCSKAYVTKVLRGESNFTIDTMVKFARAIGLLPRIDFVPETRFWARAYYMFPGEFGKTKKPMVKFDMDLMACVDEATVARSDDRRKTGIAA